MKIWIPKNREDLRKHLSDPLFKNAYFLMLSSVTSAGSGFFFWLIAARFYSAEDVGLASAIISAMGLIGMLSLLGFDVSLVRFLPEKENKNNIINIINICFLLSFVMSALLSSIFIFNINIWCPSVKFLKKNMLLSLLFIFSSVLIVLNVLQSQGVFAGLRKTEYSFYKTVVTLARLFILPFFTGLGAIGIYISYIITPFIAFMVGIYFMSKLIGYKIILRLEDNKIIVKDLLKYSLENYIARIFETLPTFILPLIIVNILGARENAYFFIAWQIAWIIHVIPEYIAISLLAEGSYNEEQINFNLRRATKLAFSMLAVVTLLVFLFGKHILRLFGENYAINSLYPLIILMLGNFPFAYNSLFTAVKRIEKNNKPVILTYVGISMITILSTYLLSKQIGIIGAGYGWFLGNFITALCIFIKNRSLLKNKCAI